MQVCFISECSTFSSILTEALVKNHHQLNFVHFNHPDALLNHLKPNFTHFIVKLTGDEKFDLKIKKIRKEYQHAVIIALKINKEFKTLKEIHASFDYIFNDCEIEEKLANYFHSLFSNQQSNQQTKQELELENYRKLYIHLNSNLSRCFLLATQGMTSKEIAFKMAKSERTIEKYIDALKKTFQINHKKELKIVYKTIHSHAEN